MAQTYEANDIIKALIALTNSGDLKWDGDAVDQKASYADHNYHVVRTGPPTLYIDDKFSNQWSDVFDLVNAIDHSNMDFAAVVTSLASPVKESKTDEPA